ncbi:hypothetical protein Pfo_015529, partial [Paulownia fortunei]
NYNNHLYHHQHSSFLFLSVLSHNSFSSLSSFFLIFSSSSVCCIVALAAPENDFTFAGSGREKAKPWDVEDVLQQDVCKVPWGRSLMNWVEGISVKMLMQGHIRHLISVGLFCPTSKWDGISRSVH